MQNVSVIRHRSEFFSRGNALPSLALALGLAILPGIGASWIEGAAGGFSSLGPTTSNWSTANRSWALARTAGSSTSETRAFRVATALGSPPVRLQVTLPKGPVIAGRSAPMTLRYVCSGHGSCPSTETLSLADFGARGRLIYQETLGRRLGPLVTLHRGLALKVSLPIRKVAGTYHLQISARGVRTMQYTYVVRAAAPERIMATVTPSPFVPVGGTAEIVANVVDAYGNPVSLSRAPVHVILQTRDRGMYLARPTASERRNGVVALLRAGSRAGAGSLVVASPGVRALSQVLKVKVYSNPADLVAGKGAWASLSTYDALGPKGILHRMVAEGVTHLYLETTGLRFYGQHMLDAVVEQAHNAGIAVIAWDYASLLNPSTEASSAQATLNFRTPVGAQVDGLAGDFEQNLSPGAMRVFSSAVRQAAGPNRAYVGVIYPPQAGFNTPIATMAQYVNVFAPMDYWLTAARPYTPAEAANYVSQSISALRNTPGENGIPIEVISQTQNVENTSGFGLYNPPPAQIEASVRAAEAGGAIGVSFYDLRTQTAAQIAAIRAMRIR